MPPRPRKVLVTGASGYIGGRLVARLRELGHPVRCLARHPSHLEGRRWPGVEIVRGDALEPRTLARALDGVDAAYYLIHSMSAVDRDFARHDRQAASNFARAAKAAGVRRVVYLGGLGGAGAALSDHLRCRHEVGEILRREGPPVVEFRAAVIIGSGSLSFEMMRHLVERHPVIPSFPWLRTLCQPIAIRDVLSYLTLALEAEAAEGRVFEIGGATRLTYEDMLRLYARRRGLGRWFVPLPSVSPRLCAAWIEAVTPIPAGYALPLIESLRNEVIVRDDAARRAFSFAPLDYDTALRYALLRIKEGAVQTTWTMALFPRHRAFTPLSVVEGLTCEERREEVDAPAEAVYAVFSGIGGERGWLYADWLWKLRAALDLAVGGVGLRRGRRHPDEIVQGEPLDFWRVERAVEGRLLLLRAEMSVPGKAWLQFESSPAGPSRSVLRVSAYFDPDGFWGGAYWLSLVPAHKVLLRGLARAIRGRAESRGGSPAIPPWTVF